MNISSFLMFSDFADSSFARLFTEMNEWTIVLFALGIIFCAIEMCIPGFGFFGIAGSILVVAGIIVRMVCGGDLYMLLYMVLIALILFIVMFVVASQLIRKSKLGKTAIFDVGTAVPEDKTEGTKNYDYLIGKTGKAITLLRPSGKADFDGEVVDVVARDGFVEEGASVTVLQVEGQRVVVK
ncbi:MAG: hypothetical protein NC099_00460 [Corallococcus sp.]|nr:hypothetical protein [Bacillota bacterium]MCM1533106.1 hypothetical protein [Corallococcus sp.]